ncbi:MAG: ABC transporter ATP-binding protein [Candidatus Omnitrophota bacterium]|nr:ABC transporter ATP-binding protein [Candidatus Omnitrophota bacterium]
MISFINKKTRELIDRLKRLIKFARKRGVPPKIFILPIILSLMTAALEGLYISLFYPLADGLLKGDFKIVYNIRFLGGFIKALPESIGGTNSGIFFTILALLVGVLIIKLLCRYLATVLLTYHVVAFAHNLRTEIFDRYLTYGKFFFDRNSNSRIYTVLISFPGTIASKLLSIQTLVISFFTLAIYLIIMSLLSWPLTLVLIAGFPLFHYSLKGLISRIKKGSQHATLQMLKVSRKALDVLVCMPLIKVYAREPEEKREFDHESGEARKSAFNVEKKQQLVPVFNEFMTNIMILVLLGCIVFIVRDKGLNEIPKFLVFFLLVRRSAIHMGAFNQFKSSMAGIVEPIRQVREMLNDNNKFYVTGGKKQFKGLNDSIEFRDLNFSYIRGMQVIKNVSFKVKKGQVVAIVGPTGSGKTTLTGLFLRFYDCPPETIFLDGTDIKEFSILTLMKQMALVSQNTFIFNATIRKNIVYGLERETTPEALEETVKKAQLHDFIESLPEGLETVVGDQGVRLSGGEKQRVALARALLKPSEILILDEATSSLDSITEKLVQKAIDEAVKGRTTIVIAHRLSTIKHADKIVVLENGSITEQGTLQELLAGKGKFYHLWEEQKFD